MTPEMVLVLPTPDPNLTYLPNERSPNQQFQVMHEDGGNMSLLSQDQLLNDVWLRMWAKSVIERDGAREVVDALSTPVSDDFLLAAYMEFFLQLRHACAEDAEEIVALIDAFTKESGSMNRVDMPVLATVMSLVLHFGFLSERDREVPPCWDGIDNFKASDNLVAWCFAADECVNEPAEEIIGLGEKQDVEVTLAW